MARRVLTRVLPGLMRYRELPNTLNVQHRTLARSAPRSTSVSSAVLSPELNLANSSALAAPVNREPGCVSTSDCQSCTIDQIEWTSDPRQ